jgi:hypothetical protein
MSPVKGPPNSAIDGVKGGAPRSALDPNRKFVASERMSPIEVKQAFPTSGQ